MSAVLINIALAFATCATLLSGRVWSPVPVQEKVESISPLFARAETAMIERLTNERTRMQNSMFELGDNAYLLAGIEDLDQDAVRPALINACQARGLTLCEAFDEDGDLLARTAASNGLKKITLAPKERNAAKDATKLRWSLNAGKLDLIASGALGRRGERIGYLRIMRRFDQQLAIKTAATLGFDLALLGAHKAPEIASSTPLSLAEDAAFPTPINSKLRLVPAPKALATIREARSLGLPLALRIGLLEDVPAPPPPPEAFPTTQDQEVLVFAASIFLIVNAILQRFRSLRLAASVESTAANARQVKLETALKEAATERADAQQRIDRIADLLSIESAAFHFFCDKVAHLQRLVAAEIASLGTGSAKPVRHLAQILRHVHTLKSNAKLFNMNHVHHAARAFEEMLATQLREGDALDKTAVDALTSHLGYIVRETEQYKTLRFKLLGANDKDPMQDANIRLHWLLSLIGRMFTTIKNARMNPTNASQLFTEYQNAIASLGRIDLGDYVLRYGTMLTDLAEKAGKRIGSLRLVGNCRFFPQETMQSLNDMLLHCLRNAIDHGIETQNKRGSAGKDPAGTITIESKLFAGVCHLRVLDDGRGVDVKELTAKLIRKGLLTEESARARTPAEILDLLFTTGFSTANTVTELSGRGVGLDVVREMARQLGGDARLSSEPGRGMEVAIHFPMAESRFQSRLSVFNIHSEIETLAEGLRSQLGQTRIELVTLPHTRVRALALCDRFLFNEAIRDLLQTLNTHAPKPCRISIAIGHQSSADECRLDTFVLSIAVQDAIGKPLPEILQLVDLGIDGRLFGTLLECGLYLPEKPAPGRIEVHMPSGIATTLRGFSIDVIASVEDPQAAEALIGEMLKTHFGAIPLRFHADADLHALPKLAANSCALALIEGVRLQDPTLVKRLAAMDALTVVVVAEDLSLLPLKALFSISKDPLLLEGGLDRAAVMQALEFALQSAFFAYRNSKDANLGLENSLAA